jgi:hypothetical protein
VAGFLRSRAEALDRIVDFMNQGPKATRNVRDVIRVDSSILWAGASSGVCGLAVAPAGGGSHRDGVEAVSADGERLWIASLPALRAVGRGTTEKRCVVTPRTDVWRVLLRT